MRTFAILIGLSALLALSCGQGIVQINHLAHVNDCDLDTDLDGLTQGLSVRGSWGERQVSIEAAGASFTIDREVKMTGFASQRITISRAQGQAGSLMLWSDAISDRDFYVPSQGTPFLVRFNLRIDQAQNVSVSAVVTTGSRNVTILQPMSQPTGGWMPVSAVVPVELNSAGQPYFRFRFVISLGEGAASARLWVDSISAIGLQIPSPGQNYNGLSPIRILNYLSPPNSWMELLNGDVKYVISSAVNTYPLGLVKPDLQWGYYVHCLAHSGCGLFELVDYCYADRHHPEWFLTDEHGNRIVRHNNDDVYLMDIANPALQAHAVSRIQQLAQLVPEPRWVFLDNALTWRTCVQYPTEASFLSARVSYARTLAQAFRRHWPNAKILLNNGGRAGRYLDGNWGTYWIEFVDGVMLENSIVRSDGQSYSYALHYHREPASNQSSDWYTIMRAVYAYPQKHWWIVACPNVEDTEMVRYTVASYLMLCRENTALMLKDLAKPTHLQYQLAIARPELYVPLGRPLGDFRVVQGQVSSGALFARDFQYGIALVNPHAELSFQYRTPRAYKDWDGNVIPANTLLTIGPRRGVVLYAAPEITISIAPTQVTALPGETLTFTVQYRNSGLADAANVKIEVPLPSGLEFVSSSTGGQYSNHRVTWTLPQVRAGQSGTLTFQARVQ